MPEEVHVIPLLTDADFMVEWQTTRMKYLAKGETVFCLDPSQHVDDIPPSQVEALLEVVGDSEVTPPCADIIWDLTTDTLTCCTRFDLLWEYYAAEKEYEVVDLSAEDLENINKKVSEWTKEPHTITPNGDAKWHYRLEVDPDQRR